jgi:hypothetical protein
MSSSVHSSSEAAQANNTSQNLLIDFDDRFTNSITSISSSFPNDSNLITKIIDVEFQHQVN